MHPSHVVRNGSKSTEWMARVAAALSVVAAALTQWLVRIAKWDRAFACCSRTATAKTRSPGTESWLLSSTKPRRRRPSTTTGSSYRVEPPPNNLISSLCSSLSKSSQFASAIVVRPVRWAIHAASQCLVTGRDSGGLVAGASFVHWSTTHRPHGEARIEIKKPKKWHRCRCRLVPRAVLAVGVSD
jgi:hypothetical protein